MTKSKRNRPQIGPAFNPEDMNETGRIESYIDELRYYRPRGFGKLIREGNAMISADNRGNPDALEHIHEWFDDCDSLLSSIAGDYIAYGPFPHGGAIGFYALVESAIEDANHIVDDSRNGRDDGPIPRGFTGLYVHISDHGNVSAYRYSRGKSRELFAVV